MVSTDIVFAPLIGWGWIALLALLLSAPFLYALYRRARGALWRLGFLIVLVATLANPVLLKSKKDIQPDIALMLVDESDSQRVSNRLGETRKAAAALEKQMAGDKTLEWRRATLAPETADQDEGTRLFSALSAALRDIPRQRLAGVVLVTDGIAHDDERRDALKDLGAPVHALLTGDPHMRDRRLVLEEAPRFGVVGRTVTVKLRVDDGDDSAKGGQTLLRWSVDGADPQTLPVSIGKEISIPFTPDHAGANVIRFEVDALSGEATLMNNQALLSLSGVRDRLRVLLISGEPHPGERLWRSVLKSDPAVDLVHFTILRLPNSRDLTPVPELALIPFPTRELFEEKLVDFDLVVFDRYTLRGVLQARYLANLADYVRGGGAILAAVGPEYAQPLSLANTALGDVLPARPSGGVYEDGFRPDITDLGRRHPVTAGLRENWRQGEWGRWFRLIEADAEDAPVLMSGLNGKPLLVLNRVGDGRIALVLSDQLWLWGRGFEGGGPLTELTRRLAHWLMKEPDLEEESLRAEARGREIQITRQSLKDEAGSVEITAPDGSKRSLDLSPAGGGLSQTRIDAALPGLYEVTDGEHTALAAAGPVNAREMTRLRPTAAHVAPLADATGGGVLWLQNGLPGLRRVDKEDRAFGRDWFGLKRNAAGPTLSVRQTPLLPAWAGLVLLLGLAALAWFRESR